MENHTDISASLNPEPSHRTDVASKQSDYRIGGQLPLEYVAPREHVEPMQIPSNSMPPGETWQDTLKNGQNMFTDEPIDCESIKGIFGWETVDDTSIPYILRKQKKFVSVRIVERKLLSKYPNTFPDELGQKEPLVSYFITEAEANLLNEINTAHCDFEYGHNPFTVKDLIVDLEEFEEFFKIVKKTFPADVLAKISEEPAPAVMPSPVLSAPVKTDLSKFCGWIQINNTVSPYIIRFDNGKQVKLVPLSVIVYAAGLLTNSGVDGLLPTPQECAMLNEACKAAGFDFLFGKNTRLISITEVLQRCQVQLFELPFQNPLQHARYLDHRTGQPSSSLLMGVGSHPQGTTASAQHQPHPPMRQGSLNLMSGNPAKLNHYATWFPPSSFHPSQVTMSGGLSGIPAGLNSIPGVLSSIQGRPSNFQQPPSPSSMYLQRSRPGLGIESSHLPNTRFQNMAEKNTDNCSSAQQGLSGSLWPLMPRGPSPAHANNSINSAVVSETPSIAPEHSSTPVYQPHSLPPNPLLHSISSPTMPDLNHPIFRSPMGMPPRSQVAQSMHKDITSGIARYAPPVTRHPPPPSQYSISQSYPFRANQFDTSLFSRTKPNEQRQLGDINLVSTLSSSRHHTGESQKHPSSHSTNNTHKSVSKAGSGIDPNSHIITSIQPPNSCNNNHSKPYFSHTISACLVNGKSISCITVDLPHRKGRFCLVEAVSKLYFPTVPLTEFVKVLQVVLKVNLHECTSEEEAAFVQYYSLPVNKLKCNKIIRVDDLEMYFPQLNYMFTKCSMDEQTAQPLSPTEHSASQKRKSSSSPSGPPMKTAQPKSESGLNYGRDTYQNGDSLSNAGSGGAPIIVIDDE